MAARRAITLRPDSGSRGIDDSGTPRLGVVFGLGYDDTVDEHAGYLYVLRLQRSPLGDPFHLDDDKSAAVVYRGGDGKGLEEQSLVLHADIAGRVGGGAAKERDIQPLECLVEQVLFAADCHQLYAVFGGLVVDLAAADAGVDEGTEANPSEQTRLAGRGVAEQLRDHALR
jgi:hypothetical protein